MVENKEPQTARNVYGILATICLLAFLFQCIYMFLQWGDIEEGGSQELEYLTMFIGIAGMFFLVLNRTSHN
ncbi:hypothetical protein DSAG12_00383 [Promethearchaeum syntrophicum]|uniref:Uncharacterized protein n=1 Tax=Promethearchaeum syntrophicum TaxID=2594042 RepID=A0A5B9D6V8_9ARCH|nr:hypothetical protein [Candidatus Prometheoarchaeum syntrophicum]QEE14570.1 hypothetical protein DSAG12_00383 [Candidatus Prometheoarchaeum syntrophicum]